MHYGRGRGRYPTPKFFTIPKNEQKTVSKPHGPSLWIFKLCAFMNVIFLHPQAKHVSYFNQSSLKTNYLTKT
jgi:hypothetical protein